MLKVAIFLGVLGPVASPTAVGGAHLGLSYKAKRNFEVQTRQFEHAKDVAEAERQHADAVAKAERQRVPSVIMIAAI